MKRFGWAALVLLASLSCSSVATARLSDCDSTLLEATYRYVSSDYYAASFFDLLNDESFARIKNNAGAGGTFMGVELSGKKEDFIERGKHLYHDRNSEVTRDEAINILATELRPINAQIYEDCLKAQIASSNGLHLYIDQATYNKVILKLSWRPVGRQDRKLAIDWSSTVHDGPDVPHSISENGEATVVVDRPPEDSGDVVVFVKTKQNIPCENIRITPIHKPIRIVTRLIEPSAPADFTGQWRIIEADQWVFEFTATVGPGNGLTGSMKVLACPFDLRTSCSPNPNNTTYISGTYDARSGDFSFDRPLPADNRVQSWEGHFDRAGLFTGSMRPAIGAPRNVLFRLVKVDR